MRYLNVGTSRNISKIGLGTWQFGSAEWGYGEAYSQSEAPQVIRRALELGVNLFDTAEIYSSGRSERILGQALGEMRETGWIGTKIWPIVAGSASIKRRALASMRRLGRPVIDLYQVHWPNPLLPDASIMRGMRSLQRAGLVDEVGVSSYSLNRWRGAEAALGGRVLSNQIAYSLLDRSPERDLIPFAEASDHVIIAFSPLANGLLSGRYHEASRPLNQVRAGSLHFQSENLRRTSGLMTALREVADAHSATPAQIALAWVIRSPAVVAIPGASSVKQMESNVAAADIDLADDEYQALNRASGKASSAPAPDASPPRKVRHFLYPVKHTAKGGQLLAKTMWADHKSTRPVPGGRKAGRLAP